MEEKILKTIEFTTENGGVKPATRKALKSQVIKHLGLDGGDFELMPDKRYGKPIAIDYRTGKTIYLLVDAVVGFEPKPKEKKAATDKKETKSVEIPDLFD